MDRHPAAMLPLLFPLLFSLHWATAAAALAAAPASLQVSQVTAKGTDLVAYVRVQDEAGALVPGLTAGQVHATVGAETAKVSSFTPFAETGEGVTWLLLVDSSQSIVGARFEQLREALRAWVAALSPADRAGIIAFGSEVRTLVAPTADHAALNTAIAGLTNKDRQTRLHGALIQALTLAHRQEAGLPDRRVIVVLSDGLDDAPGDARADEVLARQADAGVPIYAVAFPGQGDKARRAAGLDALGQFARRSGGTVVSADAGDPGPILTALRERIRAVYQAVLQCPGCTTDGNRYRVQIALTAGGLTLDDGMDTRLYPVAALNPESTAAPQPSAQPAESTPPPVDRTRTWVMVAAAAGGLLALVVAVVWFLRRRAAVPAAETLIPVVLHTPAPVPEAPTPAASPAGPEVTLAFRTGARRGQSVRLVPAPAILLGRDHACTLVLPDDDRVSGRHARIRALGRTLLIEDLDSTNGTALNGVALCAASPLTDGDLIRLGGTELRIGLPGPATHRGTP